jgi:hypothetical protein
LDFDPNPIQGNYTVLRCLVLAQGLFGEMCFSLFNRPNLLVISFSITRHYMVRIARATKSACYLSLSVPGGGSNFGVPHTGVRQGHKNTFSTLK